MNSRTAIRKGQPTSSLSQAQAQVAKWHNWLKRSRHEAEKTLVALQTECWVHGTKWYRDPTFAIIIGRRDQMLPEHQEVRAALANQIGAEIMSWDRLLEDSGA